MVLNPLAILYAVVAAPMIAAPHIAVASDDPPAFLSYRMSPDDPVPSNPRQVRNWALHHVHFGVALEEKLKANTVEVYLKYPGVELPFDNEMEYLMHHLKQQDDIK